MNVQYNRYKIVIYVVACTHIIIYFSKIICSCSFDADLVFEFGLATDFDKDVDVKQVRGWVRRRFR